MRTHRRYRKTSDSQHCNRSITMTRPPAAGSLDERCVRRVLLQGMAPYLSVTKMVYPDGEDMRVEAFAKGGKAEVLSLTAWTMKSVWE